MGGYIGFSPAEKVTRFKVPEREILVFTLEELTCLLISEEHLLILFALNTGCRLGEIVGLRWSRVDFELKFATIDTIYEEKTKKFAQRTKGKRVRRVPLNEGSIRLLKEMTLEGA